MTETQDDPENAEAPAPVEARESSPYQLTLAAMEFPWLAQCAFNAVAGLGLGLVGAPRIGFVWAFLFSIIDLGLSRILRGWSAKAAETDSDTGLRRLSILVGFRTTLWMLGPVIVSFGSHGLGGLAYTAVSATGMIALGVSFGWTSRQIFAAMIIPSLAAVATATAVTLGSAGAGVFVGLLSLIVSLSLIAFSTHKAVGEWNLASQQTLAALGRSEAAERRLRVAIEIADLHVYEVDYTAHTLTSLGAESDFFESPLTYERMWRDPHVGVAPGDRRSAAAAWARYLAGEGPYRTEYRVRRSDGRQVWAFATAELTRDADGKPLTLVGALHNVTDRKRNELRLLEALERAEAGSRAKSEFLATMSHEIRTPLNGVLGMAQAMEGGELTPVQRRRVEVIRRSGESLLLLLNSVLDLSKIEAGKFDLEDGEVDIGEVARAALDAFSEDAAEKELDVTLEVSSRARGIYAGDPARITQVLYNLVSNAVKFTTSGSVGVAIDRRGKALVINVTDSGIGISEEQQRGLFEKFVQADASVTRRYGGSGLGLAISRELVVRMGGSIEVKSEPGLGSTFTVSLPLQKIRPRKTPAGDLPAEQDVVAGVSRLRVLVAEDNPVNQFVLQTMLERLGIAPVSVVNGKQVVAAWREGDWDLILMDVRMPVMDGVTATRTIRAEEVTSGRRPTPIIGVTANVMAHQVEHYRAVGMDDVIGKPIEAQRLLKVMETCLPNAPSASGVFAE